MTKVSIIIPIYNAEKYIDKCISSIANQTLDDIEIIAVNDGSTDNSLNKLDELSLKYKGKIKIFDKENGGAGSARNLGIENASGEFIKFVDSDDYLDLNILEKMYTLAKENNVSLVRGNYQTIIGPFKFEDKCCFKEIKGNQIIDVRKDKDYMACETPGIGNKLISRDLIGDLRFPEKTKWEDLAIMPVIVASSGKVYHLDEKVYNYRVHMNTTMSDFIRKIPNILDIVKCVDYIKDEMEKRKLNFDYKEQIESLYALHTLFRVENAMLWLNLSKKNKKIVISSLMNLLDIKSPNWMNNPIVKDYQTKNALFRFDMNRLDKFIDKEYRFKNELESKKNIQKVLKKM